MIMYLVTAKTDKEYDTGVEVAGIFDTEEKANKVKEEIEEWYENDDNEDYEVFVTPTVTNNFSWYEINKNIKIKEK